MTLGWCGIRWWLLPLMICPRRDSSASPEPPALLKKTSSDCLVTSFKEIKRKMSWQSWSVPLCFSSAPRPYTFVFQVSTGTVSFIVSTSMLSIKISWLIETSRCMENTRGGIYETGATFDADLEKEQSMIEQGVARMMDCESIKEYVTLVNNKLQDKLLFRQGVRAAPASPCSSDEDAHPPVPVPVPLVGTQPSGHRRKNFVYPDPQRRLRSKTTPPKLPEELEMLASWRCREGRRSIGLGSAHPPWRGRPDWLWSWWGRSRPHGPQWVSSIPPIHVHYTHRAWAQIMQGFASGIDCVWLQKEKLLRLLAQSMLNFWQSCTQAIQNATCVFSCL